MLFTDIPQIQWREPLWLLLTLQPLVMLIAVRVKNRRQLAAYADKSLLPWLLPRNLSHKISFPGSRLAYYAAWILLVTAAAGPRYAEEYISQNPADDVDIAMVVDVSLSMRTTDVSPNRLQRAKLEIKELLQHLHHQRVALIVYAGKAHLYVPLTQDYEALRFYLNSLDKLILPAAGSRPQEALSLAIEELSHSQLQESSQFDSKKQLSNKRKAIVLISDGDFTLDAGYQNTVDEIKADGIALAVLGIGTVEGDVIPLPGGGWLYQDEKAVISRLQESNLKKLVALTGGYYTAVQDGDQDWKVLYDQGIDGKKNRLSSEESDANIVWRELYQLLLFPAVLLFFYSVIPYRFNFKPKVIAIVFLPVAFCGALWGTDNAHAQGHMDIQTAYAFYEKHDFSAAADIFTNIAGYQGRLGEGASRYRLSDYDNAINSFARAVLEANNDQERGVALYNLGNSYFQAGNYAEAERVYEDALRYRAHHAATRDNLAVSRALKRLVEKRSRAISVADRAGRGPLQAPAKQNMILGENDSVTLDQSRDLSPKLRRNLPLDKLNHEQLEYLIKRGLAFVHVVTSGVENKTISVWRRDGIRSAPVEQKVNGDNERLWQRLFEIEEGFPAPLDAPVNVPGVPSW